MSDNYQQLPMEPWAYPTADHMFAPQPCSKCTGVDDNCDHDGLSAPNLGEQGITIDPALIDLQAPGLRLLAGGDDSSQSITAPSQTSFAEFIQDSQTFSGIPLRADPFFDRNSRTSTYHVGDRMRPAGDVQSGRFSMSTATSSSQTDESPQHLADEGTGPTTPGSLRRIERQPTGGRLLPLRSREHLHPLYPFHVGRETTNVAMRPVPIPRLPMRSSVSDTQSLKPKRSPEFKRPASHAGESSGLTCNHPGCRSRKTFSSPKALGRHQQNHIPREDRPFKCDLVDCNGGFFWPKDLDRHMLKHTKQKNFVCQKDIDGRVCGKRYSRRDNMRRHQRLDHDLQPPPSSVGSSQRVL